MRICVIGGANTDITATSAQTFRHGDSNPGSIRISPGGVARNIAHNLALLGDEVHFAGIFGADDFGTLCREACIKAGIDLSLSEARADVDSSCYMCINSPEGELIGGVADMKAPELITPSWLEARLEDINSADAVVADSNIPAASLAWLIDNCIPPLYLDAVSVAKASRIADAMTMSFRTGVHAVKCNRLEDAVLSNVPGIGRRYVTLGSEGALVYEDGIGRAFPALPGEVVNATGAGDALFAGIIHAGPQASAQEALQLGLRCAKYAIECKDAVNPDLAKLIKR